MTDIIKIEIDPSPAINQKFIADIYAFLSTKAQASEDYKKIIEDNKKIEMSTVPPNRKDLPDAIDISKVLFLLT